MFQKLLLLYFQCEIGRDMVRQPKNLPKEGWRPRLYRKWSRLWKKGKINYNLLYIIEWITTEIEAEIHNLKIPMQSFSSPLPCYQLSAKLQCMLCLRITVKQTMCVHRKRFLNHLLFGTESCFIFFFYCFFFFNF